MHPRNFFVQFLPVGHPGAPAVLPRQQLIVRYHPQANTGDAVASPGQAWAVGFGSMRDLLISTDPILGPVLLDARCSVVQPIDL